MPIIQEPLTDKRQTVDRIFYLARKYAGDLDEIQLDKYGQRIRLSDLSLQEFFNLVKNIPYVRDQAPIEIVARPRIILQGAGQGAGKDCKKAAVLLGAYFTRKRIPWRLVTVSTRPDKMIHHIFPQARIYLGGEYLNADATYSNMRIGQVKKVTAIEVFK